MRQLTISAPLLCLSMFGGRANAQLDINLSPTQNVLVLGEVAVLRVEISNKGSGSVRVPATTASWNNYFAIYVSRSDGLFERYVSPIAGSLDESLSGGFADLMPGATTHGEIEILWGHGPEMRSPSQELFMQRRFPFDSPGIYQIKVKESEFVDGHHREPRGESSAIRIVVHEAFGADERLWNLMRETPEVAYFIQTADWNDAWQEDGHYETGRQKLDAHLKQETVDALTPLAQSAAHALKIDGERRVKEAENK